MSFKEYFKPNKAKIIAILSLIILDILVFINFRTDYFTSETMIFKWILILYVIITNIFFWSFDYFIYGSLDFELFF